MKSIKFFLLLVFSTLFVAACGIQSLFLPDAPLALDETPDFLANLTQVNDYPFYTAEYIGDYGFDAYLESGIYPVDIALINQQNSYACSCFYAGGDSPIFGRNFDWYESPALLLFTDPPGGFRSMSMVDISYLGYDQYLTPFDEPELLKLAPFLPFDGMNEYGLAIGMMAVGHAEGGNGPKKRTLDSLELIRLILDHAIDVPDALDLIRDYNVDFGSVPVHYLISDRKGNSVIVEYLDNEIVVIESDQAYQVATNFIISEVQPRGANTHSNRYNTLVRALSKLEGVLEKNFAMDLLADVSQSGSETATRWSIVYDMRGLSVSVAINRNFQELYNFKMD